MNDLGIHEQKLSDDEIAGILKTLKNEDLERRKASPKILRIVADGLECAEIDVADPKKSRCEFAEGAKLLEIWTKTDGTKILLGTHCIDYTRWDGVAPAVASFNLSQRRELRLTIKPVGKEPGQRHVQLELECKPVFSLTAWLGAFRGATLPRSPVFFRFVLIPVVLLAAGWLAAVFWHGRLAREQEARIQQLQKKVVSEQEVRKGLEERLQAGQPLAYTLSPAELQQRGVQGKEENLLQIPSASNLLVLELPVGISKQASYRALIKHFPKGDEVLVENHLNPRTKAGELVVDAQIPCGLLQNHGHYVLDLFAPDPSGAWTRIHTFRFQIIKN